MPQGRPCFPWALVPCLLPSLHAARPPRVPAPPPPKKNTTHPSGARADYLQTHQGAGHAQVIAGESVVPEYGCRAGAWHAARAFEAVVGWGWKWE